MPIIKSGTRLISLKDLMRMDQSVYGRIQPKRPAVMRKGNTVEKCMFHEGTKNCLGVNCFWSRAGTCPIYNRLNSKAIKFGSMRKSKFVAK